MPEQVDPTQVEALVEALGKLDPSMLNKELVRSLGDVVGFDKEDSIGKPFVTREEDEQFVTVFNSYTGLASRITVTMLPRLMTRKFGPQHVEVPREFWGKRVWTATQPKVAARITFPCIFGEDAPEREDVVAAGQGHLLCRKHNIPNEHERTLHAQHTHKSSMKAYEAYVARKRSDEDRAATREMLNVIAELAKAK